MLGVRTLLPLVIACGAAGAERIIAAIPTPVAALPARRDAAHAGWIAAPENDGAVRAATVVEDVAVVEAEPTGPLGLGAVVGIAASLRLLIIDGLIASVPAQPGPIGLNIRHRVTPVNSLAEAA